MKSRNAELRSYYRKTVRMLPCSRKIRMGLRNRLHEDVEGFLEEHPQASAQAVREKFGAPETIAAAYVESMGTQELLVKLKLHRTIAQVIGIFLAVALVAACTVKIWSEIALQRAMQGTVIITVSDGDETVIDDPYLETWETVAYYP